VRIMAQAVDFFLQLLKVKLQFFDESLNVIEVSYEPCAFRWRDYLYRSFLFQGFLL
jgi:hypothetical protein